MFAFVESLTSESTQNCPSLDGCDKPCLLFGRKRDINRCEICECVKWDEETSEDGE